MASEAFTLPTISNDHISVDEFLNITPGLIADESMDLIEQNRRLQQLAESTVVCWCVRACMCTFVRACA